MNKFVWSAFIVFCVVHLSGCAIPEKPKVSQIPPTSASKPTPVYIPDTGETNNLNQTNYLDNEEQPDGLLAGENQEVALPSQEYINGRIFEYGRKLDRWKVLDSKSMTLNLKAEETAEMVRCFRQLQEVLNGYSDLRNKMIQIENDRIPRRIDAKEVYEIQQNDIRFLENSCGRLLAESTDKSDRRSLQEEGGDLNQLESRIDRYAAKKEYEEVIQVWSKIPESQRSRTQLRTKILYGNALMYLHQEEKAAEVYQQVVDQMSDSKEQPTDLVSLRKMLADIYTASGNYRSAATEYKNISKDYLKIGELEEWSKLQLALLDRSKDRSPELKEFSAILRNYLGFIPERDGFKVLWQAEKFETGYPYSPVLSNVELIKVSVKEDAEKWFNDFMLKVDSLAREKKFDKALTLLESMPNDIIGTDKQMKIKDKNEELQLAEAVENETEKMVQIQELQNKWNNGLLLEKGERYEEAIAVFTSLLETEYGTKAESKIKEVSLEAAKADRRKAADLFIRFTKTTDLESKKKLLMETRKVLKNILVKYPDVDIVDKVRGNIDRVEQEMNAIDPNLVFMADQQELTPASNNGLNSSFSSAPVRSMIRDQTPIIENDLTLPDSQ